MMANEVYNRIAEGSATIGDVAEFFQQVINDGRFWLLPQPYQNMVFELDNKRICSINADIEPKEARNRAEDPEGIPPMAVEGIEYAELPANIDREGMFKFGLGGGIAPPLSIRRRF